MLRDPHEQGERLQRFRKDAAQEGFFDALNAVLAGASLPRRTGNIDSERIPIIYIVGVPRSGTTLLSQILSRYLPVGYINNLTARFWRRPSVGIRLSDALLGPEARRLIEFSSSYGVTSGIAGPHEFGYFWRHWLNLDAASSHHLSAEELAHTDKKGLQQALETEILAEFGKPVVFKNVICGFHAAFLTSVHRASLFVYIRRDPFSAAASILQSRFARYGTYGNWWSLKPSAYRALAALPDPVDQVAGQVTACAREFDVELSRPGVRSLTVEFDDVWRQPGRVLDVIGAELTRIGERIDPVADALPKLRAPDPELLPVEMERKLRALLT